MNKRSTALYIIILTVSLSFGMAYFVHPHAPKVEMVTEFEELPDPNAHYSVESGLPERVSKSYGLALVLVISEFSRKNATALEAIRSWAHENYQRDPGFLHAVAQHDDYRAHNSMVDSLCYNLFLPPRYLVENQILHFLKHQIETFHTTKAYQSFRADYFDSFGLDRESARMLARYQCQRAEQAVNTVLASLYWLGALGLGVVLHLKPRSAVRSSRWQRSLAFFWFALSLFYIVESWMANDVYVLVSSIICALAGIGIRRPIAISFGEDKGLSFRLLTPGNALLATATWATITLAAIQILTWIHTGSLSHADPITLIISALAGDFVHDPSSGKWYLTRIVGTFWLASCIWALWAGNRPSKIIESVEPILNREPAVSGHRR